MLSPSDRLLLFDLLRPPDGFQLDGAIGTTFSLDLLALLTAPVAFTLFDCEDSEGRPDADPLAMLEAVRRHADKIAVFCQAGQIAIPKSSQLLYGYLEDSVFEVTLPHGRGVFHPKVWLLRYSAPAGSVRYRLLCLSRNLTFDRSWDTALALEGELVERRRAFASNHPLGSFVAALPQLASRRPPQRIHEMIEVMQAEVRRVRFEPPAGFNSLSFWPLGIPGASHWPFDGAPDRMLVISPFVSQRCLERLAASGRQHILVSRPESLDSLAKETIARFSAVYVLHDAASPEPTEDESESDSEDVLDGLHAKLYLAEDGWNARVWTGSANATDSAFSSNVEFLVELSGKKSRCGIDALLDQRGQQNSLMRLLVAYRPPNGPKEGDPLQERLEALLEQMKTALINARLVARIDPLADGDFHLRLMPGDEPSRLRIPPNARVRCWPITLYEDTAVEVTQDLSNLDFGRISFEAITAFYAFELRALHGEGKVDRRFVLKLPLEGAPQGRRERILRAVLKSREQVSRFLMLLLSDASLDAPYLQELVRRSTVRLATVAGDEEGIPLFEYMVRALDRQPEKLDQVARLVEDLCKTPEGRQLLPKDFEKVWAPIWAARQRLPR